MSQCTHVIVFNSTQSTDLPAEVYTFPQIRVVSEGWIEACIHAQQLVDEAELENVTIKFCPLDELPVEMAKYKYGFLPWYFACR